MGIRSTICFEISCRRLPPPAKRTVDYQAYQDWRISSLSSSWQAFSDTDVANKDVLDFGCGDGALSLYLAATKSPRSVLGVDLNPQAIERARQSMLSAATLGARQGSCRLVYAANGCLRSAFM